jgi:4-amino-4-deoxy-L-arabinose transferase-like glycosyltransferase
MGDDHIEKGETLRQAWEDHWPLVCAVGMPLLFLLPFVNKAYHIDDTVFIWVGWQIQQHPLDFFGFIKNWYGWDMPMSLINQNPPGVSFYLAVVTALVGEQEFWVHITLLPIAVAISVGTFLIGRQMGLRRAVAAIAAMSCVFAPVYLVSCTNVMSDPLMVAWYVWAVFLWIRGIETKRFVLLALSGVCIACSVSSKYFGLSAVPLLLAYSIFRQRRPDWRWCALLVPILVVAVYEWWTSQLYGRGLFLSAVSYARHERLIPTEEVVSYYGSALIALSYMGGCMISALCFAPVIWSRRGLAISYIKPQMIPGELMVFPKNNSNVQDVYDSIVASHLSPNGLKEDISLVYELNPRSCTWMSTMNSYVGAGFYASSKLRWLPYVFADVPTEKYYIFQFGR